MRGDDFAVRQPCAPISIVIPTSKWSDRILATLASVLDCDYGEYEVIVVDQSENDLTEIAIQRFLSDERFRYLHLPTLGLARARNAGIREARNEIIAMTDDDCLVPRSWLGEIASAFALDDRIGIVMGNIFAAEHDRASGFILNYVRTSPYLARGIRAKHRVEGVGGCMAVRRSVWDTLQGFDEMLGAGAKFNAAEESDFIIRALLSHRFVYETPQVFVTHYGLRTWEVSKPLIENYIYGLSAMYVKHFKCGNWGAVFPFLHLVWRWAFQEPAVSFEHIPARAVRFHGFVRGLLRGALTPVDRVKCQYIAPKRNFQQ